MRLKTYKNNGFTLIELIIVIIIASIFGTMMYQFVYTASVRSPEPIFVLDKSLKLHEIVENITSDYLDNYFADPDSDLNDLRKSIGKKEGKDYNKGYGTYRVHRNRFIRFTANSEEKVKKKDSDYGKLLKVTIESISSGERLTILYNKQ